MSIYLKSHVRLSNVLWASGLAVVFLGMGIWLAPNRAEGRVRLGIEVLRSDNFEALKGKKTGLITNHTGVDHRGRRTIDILHDSKKVDLKCVFTPEHGLSGVIGAGKNVNDQWDMATGLPVYSLYGETKKPTPEMLRGLDVLVFDIQDVGVRFYTYIATMGMALEAASEAGIQFMVLDRPNPIRGDIREGGILGEDDHRLTGFYPLPTRHGLTVGEIANWTNQARQIYAGLEVIKMEKWTRGRWFNQTGLNFIPPSPNIKSERAALLYAGIGCFEATNISVGRGTGTPFELFGSPWIDGTKLCAYLREFHFPGLVFEPVQFTPRKDLYKGQLCEGVKILVTDRNSARPFDVFLAAFQFLYDNHPSYFEPDWEEVRMVTGSVRLKEAVFNGESWQTVRDDLVRELNQFEAGIIPFYLY